ncbi:putative colanic acid polymerase [Luteococcus japonicus]|uniref:Putative colanic acid polymerase n=1 Tax=Luteococcus japonicus TaxID=33984 RepID=A0A3N1ZWK8_9ACTN|nr:hypothetical protein [Luteococcus japonicus]ROR55240.1 putative colanic acid polymerase [Luteococcus japonicus]
MSVQESGGEPKAGLHVSLLTALLVFVGVIFQHFEIVAVVGYPLTLGALAAFVLLYALTSRINRPLFGVVISLIVSMTALAAIFDPFHATPLGYVKTLGLCLVTVVFWLSALSGLEPRWPGRIDVAAVLFLALTIIVVLCALQSVLGFFGIETFFNPWGPFQYLYHYKVWMVPGSMPRAQGFYLEPSYVALTMTFLCGALLRLRHKEIATVVITAIGLLLAGSATGLAVFMLMVLAWGLGKRGRTVVISLLAAGAMVVFAGGYLISRLSSAGDSHSSANYRLIAPLPLLKYVLFHLPLGRPMGSVEQVTLEASLVNGTDVGTTIDNGLFLLVFYFGWIGLIASLTIVIGGFYWVYRAIRSKNASAPLLVWLTMCMHFNGGIFLPEFAMMMWLALALVLTRNLDPSTPHVPGDSS